MMHFFRKAKIHLDCFTHRRDVVEYAPVVNAIEVIPSWWKKLPKSKLGIEFYPLPTMKTCTGMHDYYAKSIAMPLWSELCIDVHDSSMDWQFSDSVTEAKHHEEHQYEGFLESHAYTHLKIESPWVFSTSTNLNWVVTDPVYNHENYKDYVLAQGLLNFFSQKATHLQLFVDTSVKRTFTIPFGSPFLFTPMSDKKVVIHRHLITKQAFDSKLDLSMTSTFINKYKNHNRLPKCPYKDVFK